MQTETNLSPAARISIIMPCYNTANLLADSVRSVLAQTFQNWELIAVDDGSTDSTLEALNSFRDNRIKVASQSNQGVSAARNKGIDLATGDFIAFLDSDDIWDQRFLERMLEAMLSDEDCGLVYCGWVNVGLSGPRSKPFVPPTYEGPNKLHHLLEGNRWPIHACLTRTSLVKAAGGFDTRFPVAEDYLLWLEIASFNKIILVPEVLAQYVYHDREHASRNRMRAITLIRQAKLAFLERHPNLGKELGKRFIKDVTDGYQLNSAYEAFWRGDLVLAQALFRRSIPTFAWKTRDIPHLAVSLFPTTIFVSLVSKLRAERGDKTP